MSATPGRIERDPQTRSPAARGFRGFPPAREDGSPLLELSLFVDDVLARLGIVFLDLDLVGRGALVLGRRVEVAGAGRGLELDLLAHGLALSFPRLDLGEDGLDADLVDAPQAGGRDTQAHPAVLALDPEAAVVQVRLERAD